MKYEEFAKAYKKRKEIKEIHCVWKTPLGEAGIINGEAGIVPFICEMLIEFDKWKASDLIIALKKSEKGKL